MASQSIVLISGANRGLGYETAKNLLLSGNYHIIIGSRDRSKGEAAAGSLRALSGIHGTVSTIQLDVTDDQSVDNARVHIESDFGRLDVLVNNAGIYLLNREAVRDTLRLTLETNVTGAASLTEALLPLLLKSARPRLVFVSSSNGSMTYNLDLNSPHGGTHATEHRVAKAALNMLLVQYHMKLKSVRVLGADPGFCATDVIGDADALRRMGATEPEVGAQIISSVVKGEKDDQPGRVHGPHGVVPW
ncbi:hypothetical protein BDV32DRAFT_118529 [Aspergillus pseudonomiae]|uniref:Uncharacterized protein n=1 Tax=Aspergillus pseudonomiae TaxID=1506151 RepID=A0A5N7DFF0_9EURO|nr:uncharacterized protein BDV37DRAFT_245857 [Aspergillus pseudonomiae]KAB8263848.1 hypothetical protein BDV32DRAFT_118529 [Aspergillus pseudonomiae]KAE8405151.1 hypothetical protein BDV37DRAFT_245857 [Aspergillus pseudonomiae]